MKFPHPPNVVIKVAKYLWKAKRKLFLWGKQIYTIEKSNWTKLGKAKISYYK